MAEPVTSLHLYNPPRYRAADGSWNRTYKDAVMHSGSRIHWNPAAMLSTLAFGYVCGDLTPVHEIRRQPWLSEIGLDGEPHLLSIPPHQRLWVSYPEIARRLGDLLADEAERACQGYREIYLLLSGGLDSRVTAGTVARLRREGRLKVNPIAMTWGLPDSRDVHYGRELARMLGFEWQHVPMEAETILNNIDRCGSSLAGMVLPIHLHKMEWFQNVSPDALVLATSYGDSVGRAEYSAVHLLELKALSPFNPGGLFQPQVYQSAREELMGELQALRQRAPGQPEYVQCEHEMHGHYTRGLLAHAMSSINDYCTVYQMFTDPTVYQYMWSLHPALRFNEIYAELLDQLDPRLARLPWARTNQGMKGSDDSANSRLRVSYQQYRDWITGPLYEQIVDRIDLDRIESLGIFDMHVVRSLIQAAKAAPGTQMPYWMAWFATISRMSVWFEILGTQAQPLANAAASTAVGANGYGSLVPASPPPEVQPKAGTGAIRKSLNWRSRFRRRLEKSYLLRKWVRDLRRYLLRRRAVRAYPPHTSTV